MHFCTSIVSMTFEWDPEKARRNREQHGVSFTDAVEVFSDDYAITLEERSTEEQRYMIMGLDAFGRVLVVVYTWRGKRIRIISSRKATTRERSQYGENR